MIGQKPNFLLESRMETMSSATISDNDDQLRTLKGGITRDNPNWLVEGPRATAGNASAARGYPAFPTTARQAAASRSPTIVHRLTVS